MDARTDGRTDSRTHGRMDARTDGRMENIYSIFRDKLLLLGEHGFVKTRHSKRVFNILTPKCIPAGTKYSRSENFLLAKDFLLAKHTSHKHPNHDEPFSNLVAWFPQMNTLQPQEPLRKGLDEAAIEGFSITFIKKV